MKKSPSCGCKPSDIAWMIISAIVHGIGLFLLIFGIQQQWTNSAGPGWIIGWYSLAAIILCIGHIMKRKCGESCSAHGNR